MRRETRIGLLALVALAVMFFGYNFLKGTELFSDKNTYSVVYRNVDQLSGTDPILINGLRVGQVIDVRLNPEDVRSITVQFTTDEDLPIPKDTRATIISTGILGGKAIALEFGEACQGADCAVNGDFLVADERGILAGLIGEPEEVERYVEILKNNAGGIIDSISTRTDTNALGRTLRNLEQTTSNLNALTGRVNNLLARSSENINETAANVAVLSGSLADNNFRLESILRNVDSATTKLAGVDLGQTLAQANQTLQELRGTLERSGGAIDNLNEVSASLNSEKGTAGKLINDDEMYERLNRTIANLDLLLQDFRLNPKRYVNVSVFGKKQKEYDVPDDDPAATYLPDTTGN